MSAADHRAQRTRVRSASTRLAGRGYALPLSAALAVAKGEASCRAAPAAPPPRRAAEAKPLTRREKEIAGPRRRRPRQHGRSPKRLYLSKRTVDSHP